MALSLSDVEKIARLSKISLTDEEKAKNLEELNRIFEMIGEMQRVDTSNTAPLAHPIEMTQRLREDVADAPDCRDDFLRNAPHTESGLFLVPKVIE